MDEHEIDTFLRESHDDSPGCILLAVLLTVLLILGGAALFFTTRLF